MEALHQKVGTITKVEETREPVTDKKGANVLGQYRNIRICTATFQTGINEWQKDDVRFMSSTAQLGNPVRIILMAIDEATPEEVEDAIKEAQAPTPISE